MSDRQERGTRDKVDLDPSKTLVLPLAGEPQEEVWNIQVEVVGGSMDGLRGRVSSPSFSIGREPGNDLALTKDPMVSGNHARIVREGHHYWLEDLGSRNGVYLGDRRLTERVLIGPGTTFIVGRTELEFMPV